MEFKVGAHNYRSSKLDAFKQLHVARRIAPVLGELAPAMKALMSAAGKRSADQADAISAVLPLTRAIAAMPEEDCNYVLAACLSVVEREVGNVGWQRVWNQQAQALQYQDIEAPEMIMLAANVIGENLSNFMRALPSGSTALGQ
ncbi:phage tail assembly chaperone [Roseixanthobacter glucoisosaccharinicivorans]|uniref:phage tail assembly chaperone n=1 Tax=Roseixanthobacter glucoisosaccharinicivorans TaxID=3119923 RepID=UPI0037289D1B